MSASSNSCSDFGDETDVRLLLLLDPCKASEIDVEISVQMNYSMNFVERRTLTFKTNELTNFCLPFSSVESGDFIGSSPVASSCMLL